MPSWILLKSADWLRFLLSLSYFTKQLWFTGAAPPATHLVEFNSWTIRRLGHVRRREIFYPGCNPGSQLTLRETVFCNTSNRNCRWSRDAVSAGWEGSARKPCCLVLGSKCCSNIRASCCKLDAVRVSVLLPSSTRSPGGWERQTAVKSRPHFTTKAENSLLNMWPAAFSFLFVSNCRLCSIYGWELRDFCSSFSERPSSFREAPPFYPHSIHHLRSFGVTEHYNSCSCLFRLYIKVFFVFCLHWCSISLDFTLRLSQNFVFPSFAVNVNRKGQTWPKKTRFIHCVGSVTHAITGFRTHKSAQLEPHRLLKEILWRN